MAHTSAGHDLLVHADAVALKAIHQHPTNAIGTVIFAHGSGSSRLSTRNQWVAQQLNARGMATLLIDLLAADEAANHDNVFDIDLLGRRVIEITRWMIENSSENVGPIGYFGASTGAAAALVAAAELREVIAAVVSRGGRPDLAPQALPNVISPTLLIVGSNDDQVLRLNELANSYLRGDHELSIVDGATHLFEEAGCLEQVAALAANWFERWFSTPSL